MQKRNTLFVVLVLMMAVASVTLAAWPTLRAPCGHKVSLLSRWFPKLLPHTCWGQGVVGRMRGLHDHWDQYEKALAALSKKPDDKEDPTQPKSAVHYFDQPIGGKMVKMHVTTQRNTGDKTTTWECEVDGAGVLAGNYFMTGDGQIHFNEDHAATAKDEVLPQ
jgi:hypothetical protein